MFAWEAYEHGNDIHPLADPTKLEVMHKEFQVNKGDFQSEQKQSVLERYGGEQHLEAPPRELLLAQTEEYLEYSRYGNIIKGQERSVAKSRYEEDLWNNNHTVREGRGRDGQGREGGREANPYFVPPCRVCGGHFGVKARGAMCAVTPTSRDHIALGQLDKQLAR